MSIKQYILCLVTITIILFAQVEALQSRDKGVRTHRSLVTPPLTLNVSASTVSSLLDRIRGVDQKAVKPEAETSANDDEEIQDDDEEIDGEEIEDEEPEDSTTAGQSLMKKPDPREWTDMFGNQLKDDGNKTTLVIQNKARDLGLLTLKAILLGPLIGLTIKAALIRGLLWAVGAYFLHLFFPSLLSTLGLGTGLVGFARQMQPNLAQLVLPHLANFTMCAIDRSQGITN